MPQGTNLFPLHVETFQNLGHVNLLDRFLPLLAKGQVSQENGRVEAQGIHILTRRGVYLARARKLRALGLGLGRGDDVGNTHELQQPLALGVVLAGDAHRPPRKLLDIFGRARFLGLLEAFGSFLLARETLGQLARLQLGGCAVKDVDGLDAVVNHTQGAVEHAHKVRSRLAAVVHELLAIGADGDEEGVDAHRPAGRLAIGLRGRTIRGRLEAYASYRVVSSNMKRCWASKTNNCHLAAKVVLDFALLDRLGRILLDDRKELLDTHLGSLLEDD
jgi:hypothetical protein